MRYESIINKVVAVSEEIFSSQKIELSRIIDVIKLIDSVTESINLNVYRGYLIAHCYRALGYLPEDFISFDDIICDDRFLRCIEISDSRNSFPSMAIGDLYFEILTIPDSNLYLRDILLGSFLYSVWSIFNEESNIQRSVQYGLEIVKAAFRYDNFDYLKNKLRIEVKGAKVINPCGSGKKSKNYKLLNISSMAALVTAAIGEELNNSIIVAKTASRASSSVTGSADIFSLLGVNLNISNKDMVSVAQQTCIGIFSINNNVPRLNHVYDGRLYNVQVFAGLVGGAAIVCPIEVDFINYGLTRGYGNVCIEILKNLYPQKDIIVTKGNDSEGRSVMDQISIVGNTDFFEYKNRITSVYTKKPMDFGFDYGTIKEVKCRNSTEENALEFIKLISGNGNSSLEKLVAMETALNLYGADTVRDFKKGAELAIETIRSGRALDVLEKLIVASCGDTNKLYSMIRSSKM